MTDHVTRMAVLNMKTARRVSSYLAQFFLY